MPQNFAVARVAVQHCKVVGEEGGINEGKWDQSMFNNTAPEEVFWTSSPGPKGQGLYNFFVDSIVSTRGETLHTFPMQKW